MPARIRIMHVVDAMGQGGLENGLVNMIEHLDPNRFDHVVCAIRRLGPSADRIPTDRAQVICLGRKDTDLPLHSGALVRAIHDVEPDIVHSRNWGAIEAVIAGKWVRSCAVLHSEHGLESSERAKEPSRRIWFRRLAFELADRVVSVSNQLRDLHARRTGFAAHKIDVIHNGVDNLRYFPDPEVRVRVRRELCISPDEFCIGSVGNLLPVKDHMTLLRALEKFDPAYTNWRLVVIGKGPELPRLEDFVRAHPHWSERILFLGASNRVSEILNAMDVYVLPSISEGICNSLLEAMATGLPVVATATGGNPEVILNGESGLLFPVKDSELLAEQMLALSAGRDLRVRLGQGALRRVTEDFSIDSMVRTYAQMYESLVPAATAPLRTLTRV